MCISDRDDNIIRRDSMFGIRRYDIVVCRRNSDVIVSMFENLGSTIFEKWPKLFNFFVFSHFKSQTNFLTFVQKLFHNHCCTSNSNWYRYRFNFLNEIFLENRLTERNPLFKKCFRFYCFHSTLSHFKLLFQWSFFVSFFPALFFP